MSVITDDEMHGRLAQSRDYTMALLRVAPDADLPKSRPLIWEHGRRNLTRNDCSQILEGWMQALHLLA